MGLRKIFLLTAFSVALVASTPMEAIGQLSTKSNYQSNRKSFFKYRYSRPERRYKRACKWASRSSDKKNVFTFLKKVFRKKGKRGAEQG
ncbi:MAG: hypothetical protein FJZ78_09540 [Bacteroidetes bacterium]|nr:hypothetical protein [Bacteroidota bacterium]